MLTEKSANSAPAPKTGYLERPDGIHLRVPNDAILDGMDSETLVALTKECKLSSNVKKDKKARSKSSIQLADDVLRKNLKAARDNPKKLKTTAKDHETWIEEFVKLAKSTATNEDIQKLKAAGILDPDSATPASQAVVDAVVDVLETLGFVKGMALQEHTYYYVPTTAAMKKKMIAAKMTIKDVLCTAITALSFLAIPDKFSCVRNGSFGMASKWILVQVEVLQVEDGGKSSFGMQHAELRKLQFGAPNDGPATVIASFYSITQKKPAVHAAGTAFGKCNCSVPKCKGVEYADNESSKLRVLVKNAIQRGTVCSHVESHDAIMAMFGYIGTATAAQSHIDTTGTYPGDTLTALDKWIGDCKIACPQQDIPAILEALSQLAKDVTLFPKGSVATAKIAVHIVLGDEVNIGDESIVSILVWCASNGAVPFLGLAFGTASIVFFGGPGKVKVTDVLQYLHEDSSVSVLQIEIGGDSTN